MEKNVVVEFSIYGYLVSFYFENDTQANKFMNIVPLNTNIDNHKYYLSAMYIRYILMGGTKIIENGENITQLIADIINVFENCPAVRNEYLK